MSDLVDGTFSINRAHPGDGDEYMTVRISFDGTCCFAEMSLEEFARAATGGSDRPCRVGLLSRHRPDAGGTA